MAVNFVLSPQSLKELKKWKVLILWKRRMRRRDEETVEEEEDYFKVWRHRNQAALD